MNKFFVKVLAVCGASALTTASESEEWLTLDKEIESLGASLRQAGTGLAVSGWLRTSYVNSSDPFSGGDDISGFFIDNARVDFDGSVGNFDVHIALEGNENNGFYGFYRIPDHAGDAVVLDAYADWSFSDVWSLRAGQFRAPFLREAWMDENEMIFWQKSVMADLWSVRDQGVMVGGSFGMIGLWGAVQNGGDDLAFSLRGDWDILGSGVPDTEGARGAASGTSLSAGIAYYDDASVTDGNAFALDAAFSMGPFAAQGSLVANGDGLGVTAPAATSLGTDTWDLDASFLFAESWEVAARYQSLDDADDTSIIDLALNKYVQGHDAKFLVQWSSGTSDDPRNEADLIILGMTVSV